jgi:thiol-disulfide isomerase/thioredoxin
MALVFIIAVRANAQTATTSPAAQLMQERKERYSQWHTGAAVPDIALANGTSLYNLTARNVIVLFWKTDCPYCEQLMPVLNELGQQYTKEELAIVAICLDNDTAAWKAYTGSQAASGLWYHKCDGAGFYGDDAVNYSVYGTPALLVADAAFTIKGNPRGIGQLKALLDQR